MTDSYLSLHRIPSGMDAADTTVWKHLHICVGTLPCACDGHGALQSHMMAEALAPMRALSHYRSLHVLIGFAELQFWMCIRREVLLPQVEKLQSSPARQYRPGEPGS